MQSSQNQDEALFSMQHTLSLVVELSVQAQLSEISIFMFLS